MGVFNLKMLDGVNAATIKELNFFEAELKRMNAELERMVKVHKVVNEKFFSLEKELVENATLKVAFSVNEVVDDYAENGFAGENVTRAISAVRSLFFDDQDLAFQDFACIDVSASMRGNCYGLDFVFESLSNLDKAFAIFMPITMVEEDIEDAILAGRDVSIDVLMLFQTRVGSSSKNGVFVPRFDSLSYAEMAEAIKGYILEDSIKQKSTDNEKLQKYVTELLASKR
jgi:hypothetical protein